MIDSIFRQLDIRGKVGSELMIDQVYDLGRAMATFFIQKNPQCTQVAVGRDGRTHSDAIYEHLCKALIDSGLNVLSIGVCPSPVLYFSLFNEPVDAGIMITASHNTKEYNGFKICLGKETVWADDLQFIKNIFREKKFRAASKKGSFQEKNVIKTYIKWLKQHFSHLVGMQQAALVDCANGAGGTVMPLLIQEMQWPQVQLLFAEVDGTYPNHEADPIVEKNMQELKKRVIASSNSIGIGLDGDCDRMAPIAHTGELIMGDKLLAIFAEDVLQDNPHAPIVYDTKCSSGLTEVLTQLKAQPIMAPSGHSIIKNQMKKNNAVLAGELSCHFFFKDRYFGYDDGIYAMMRLFEILQKTGKSLEQLLEHFPKKYITPELRLACKESDMAIIVQSVKDAYSSNPEASLLALDGVRVVLPDGWGMVRASNTQPVVCLRFEANTVKGLNRIKHEFAEILKPYLTPDSLQELE